MIRYFVLDAYDPPVVFRRNDDGTFDVFDREHGTWTPSPGLSAFVLDGRCCADEITVDRARALIGREVAA